MTKKKTGLSILVCFSIFFLVGCNHQVQDMDVITQPTQDEKIAIEEPSDEVIVDPEEDAETQLDLGTTTFVGNGTEPFWNFSASGTNLVFNEPSMSGPIDTTVETMTMSQNIAGTIITIDGTTIDIVVISGACSDGMSDAIYAYSAIMTRGSDVWNGCANIDL